LDCDPPPVPVGGVVEPVPVPLGGVTVVPVPVPVPLGGVAEPPPEPPGAVVEPPPEDPEVAVAVAAPCDPPRDAEARCAVLTDLCASWLWRSIGT
jgi:hypothetical protein